MRISGKKRVLDVTSGTGILHGILALLRSKVYALDFFDRSSHQIYRTHFVRFPACNI